MEEQTVQLGNGKDIAYRFFNDTNTPIILWSNGSIFNYKQFDWRFFPALKKKLDGSFSHLFYDYVGIGHSSRLNGDFDFVRLAEEQLELLDILGIDTVHQFGYSKGSIIDQIMAAAAPERVLSFAGYGNPNLANPDSFESTKHEFGERVANLRSIQDLWDQDIDDTNFDQVYDTVFIPTIFGKKKKQDFNLVDKIKSWYSKNRLRPLLLGTHIESLYRLYKYYLEDITEEEKSQYKEAISKIDVPVLLMHGTDDELVPHSSSELLHKWFPRSTFISFEGFSHSRPLLTGRKANRIMSEYATFLNNL